MNRNDHTTAADRAAWDLIPWVAGGGASDAERAVVERHAAACADCAAELAFQRTVRAAVVATAAAAPPLDAEAPLQRLLARIEAGETGVGSTERQAGPPARAVPRATRWLAAAAVLQAVALAALLGTLVERRPPAEYVTLSRATPGRATLRLVPSPTLSLRELQSLLARLDLEIVDASADGTLFGLVPRRADQKNATVDVLAALRATPGVLLAEPIAAPAGAPVPARP